MGGPSLNSLITFEELCRLTTRTSISKVTWLQGIQLLSDPGVPGLRFSETHSLRDLVET